MSDRLSYTYVDYNGESTNTSFSITPPVSMAAIATTITAFGVAALPLLRGLPVRTAFTRDFTLASSADKASDREAQRENKWLVTYEDNTASFSVGGDNLPNPGFKKIFNLEWGTADLTLLDFNSEVIYTIGSSFVRSQVSEFVTALEAILRSPYGGVGRVLEIRFVGRTS